MAPATVRCPICKREVPFESPEMPFCSKRCRLLDLGNWASEKYVIPGASGRPDTEDTDGSDEPAPFREAKIPSDEPAPFREAKIPNDEPTPFREAKIPNDEPEGSGR